MEAVWIGSNDLQTDTLNTANLQKSTEEECLW